MRRTVNLNEVENNAEEVEEETVAVILETETAAMKMAEATMVEVVEATMVEVVEATMVEVEETVEEVEDVEVKMFILRFQ